MQRINTRLAGTLATLTLAVLSQAAVAAGDINGFAPWNNARITDRIDAVQTQPDVKPFGVERNDWPLAVTPRVDGNNNPQADLTVRPWYTQGAI